MKIEFNNTDYGTTISVNDDSNDKELMIDVQYDNSEAWHSFKSLTEIDEFLGIMIFMRNRFAKVIGSTEEVSLEKHTKNEKIRL